MESVKHVTIPITLTGNNYLLWVRTVKSNLGGKGLWHHITTTWKGERPTEDEEDSSLTNEESGVEKALTPFEKWMQEDQAVLAALQNSLETSILQAYSNCEEAKELWDTLKTVYGDTSNDMSMESTREVEPEAELEAEEALLVPAGPMTRSRAKTFNKALGGLLDTFWEQTKLLHNFEDKASQTILVSIQAQ